MTTVTECDFESLNPGMSWHRRKEGDVEEIGFIRRTIQDVLVPEMQGLKERMAGHDEKFVSIENRLDRIEKRLDLIDARLERLVAAVERIEARLSFSELDKRLMRLEILQKRGGAGPKSSAA